MNDLRCPACGYDLRGLTLVRDRVRCPECGRSTALDALAADLVTMRRRRRAFGVDLTIMIALAITMLIVGANVEGLRAGAELRSRIGFFSRDPGMLLALGLTIAFYVLSIAPWYDLRRGDRIAFALGATFALVIVPMPWSVPLAFAWFAAFHVWSVRLAMRLEC